MLYPIGDVARRTGLSVSAIRYYADEDIVPPAGQNTAGHRLYDLHAIAQLELIRTLRDLGTGLDDIRRLLAGGTTLPDLLAKHLELVERQERDLRARRAVLRALTKQEIPEPALMHRLVRMSDDERERLIDDFWNDAGAEMPAGFVDRLRQTRPQLPDDPSVAQLEAWIELADLLQDDDFRGAVRAYLRDTFTTDPGARMTATPMQDFIHETGRATMERIMAAHRAGLSPDSPQSRELVIRFSDGAAAAAGVPASAEQRDRLAAGFQMIDDLYAQALDDPHYDATHGRYQALVAVINGTPIDTGLPAGLGAWISAALRQTPGAAVH